MNYCNIVFALGSFLFISTVFTMEPPKDGIVVYNKNVDSMGINFAWHNGAGKIVGLQLNCNNILPRKGVVIPFLPEDDAVRTTTLVIDNAVPRLINLIVTDNGPLRLGNGLIALYDSVQKLFCLCNSDYTIRTVLPHKSTPVTIGDSKFCGSSYEQTLVIRNKDVGSMDIMECITTVPRDINEANKLSSFTKYVVQKQTERTLITYACDKSREIATRLLAKLIISCAIQKSIIVYVDGKTVCSGDTLEVSLSKDNKIIITKESDEGTTVLAELHTTDSSITIG